MGIRERRRGLRRRCANASAALVLCVSFFARSSFAQSFDTLLERAITLYWSANYQEEIEVLSALCSNELRDDEAVECFKYLGFGYVAVGENERARRAFVELLSVDARYSLDETRVAPKIREQFELSRLSLVEARFDQGKLAYTGGDFEGAVEAMRHVLRLDPQHVLAREYSRLAMEKAELAESKAALENGETEPETAAPSPVPEDRVYHLTSRISPPVALSQVVAKYPLSARGGGLEGTVTVSATVGRDGSVTNVEVIRSVSRDFDREAVRAMEQWRYEPALLDGHPVAVYTLVHFRFELGRVSIHPASGSEPEPDPGAAADGAPRP